jgi:hypothetical protein
MRKGVGIVLVCGTVLLGIGTSPRYLEELRIGGGYSDPVDGGADLDKAGNISMDGALKVTGNVEVGKDSNTRGLLTLWDGAGGNAPGCLKLGSVNGTVGYVFVSNDGSGLRIHSSLPTSDTDGHWLKAQTVEDLSAPPAIGTTTPNTGKFTSCDVSGNARVTGRILLGNTTDSPEARVHIYSGDSGFSGTRNYRTANGMLMEHSDDVILLLQSGSNHTTEIWFGDADSEMSGRIRYEHASDSLHLWTNNVSRVSVDSSGNTEITGDLTVGVHNSVRGVVSAENGLPNTNPGTLKLSSPGASVRYLFVDDSGRLRIHNALPTGNSDGAVVGAQFSTTITTFTADDTTPSVTGGRVFKVPGTWTSGHNITMFDDGETGQEIIVLGGDSDCVVTDSGNLKLAGNWTANVYQTLTLVFDGTNWLETARGNN